MFKVDTEKLFIYSMWWRIVYGVLRIVLALAVLKLIGVPLSDLFYSLMAHELIEDPHDLLYVLGSHILATQQLQLTHFAAFYLFFWGVIDIVLSYSLIKHRVWAFPVSLVLVGSFVVYEIIRLSHTHSLILLWVTCVDTCILWLTLKEYKRVGRPSLT